MNKLASSSLASSSKLSLRSSSKSSTMIVGTSADDESLFDNFRLLLEFCLDIPLTGSFSLPELPSVDVMLSFESFLEGFLSLLLSFLLSFLVDFDLLSCSVSPPSALLLLFDIFIDDDRPVCALFDLNLGVVDSDLCVSEPKPVVDLLVGESED